MHIQLFFTPADLRAVTTSPDDIYIVVDVLRATTTLSVIFERGASRVFVANDIEQAREAARRYPHRILCGERNLQPLPGFVFRNSPMQLSQADLSGHELIFATTNGTQAFYACPAESMCLAGSFYNARAVAAYALTQVYEQKRNISLVCSGKLNAFALDDAICAGYLIGVLQELFPPYRDQNPAMSPTEVLTLEEAAATALTLYAAYKPPKIIDHSDAARHLINMGFLDDVSFCMQHDKCTSVPIAIGKEEGTDLYMLQKA